MAVMKEEVSSSSNEGGEIGCERARFDTDCVAFVGWVSHDCWWFSFFVAIVDLVVLVGLVFVDFGAECPLFSARKPEVVGADEVWGAGCGGDVRLGDAGAGVGRSLHVR